MIYLEIFTGENVWNEITNLSVSWDNLFSAMTNILADDRGMMV
jgi:hypothetical protein